MSDDEERLIAVVCNYSVICNGTGVCEKCPYLKYLRVVDLNSESCERADVGDVCDCG